MNTTPEENRIPDALYDRRTPAELEKLKAEWRRDPCWDIWRTEGFEAHRDELKEYQAQCEMKWEAESDALGYEAFAWGELPTLAKAQAVINGIVSDVMAGPYNKTVEGLLAQRSPTLQALATLAQAEALTRMADAAEVRNVLLMKYSKESAEAAQLHTEKLQETAHNFVSALLDDDENPRENE